MNESDFDRWLTLDRPDRPPLIMGVLNITPDSFSDGGQFAHPRAAAEHAYRMIDAGADLIDLGGESTRPGSETVDPGEQIRRVVPVLEVIRNRAATVCSIDTTNSRVAAAALDAGAHIVNDISAGRDDPAMLPLIVQRGVPVVLMHMLGRPRTMQDSPAYPRDDVVTAVSDFLRERLNAAIGFGIAPERVLFDPGIGFGKTMEHNLRLLRETGRLAALGRPLVVGASRKRFIGAITGEPQPSQRLFGTAATVAFAVANGAAIVRVHDVRPMRQVVQMTRAILTGSAPCDEPGAGDPGSDRQTAGKRSC